jgi:hypothetical protein
MRQELTYSQNCIKNELMTTISLQESVIKQKYNEMRDMDTRLDAFK